MTGTELAWMPPPYAEPCCFSEHEVTVGTGPLAVSGTVSVPRGQAPGPGVVLLAGGGPFDRDETSGPIKPLKDLAWGLASRGTTVLRFDEATHTHRDVAAASDLTMTQDTCRMPSTRSACSVATARWTPSGSSSSATGWAAKSPPPSLLPHPRWRAW
ncbi:hypothetical protein [Streptomyces rubiginosohelvolus]|uniref:hypothetical protein n=1 Tax=Streptomyces rubiginosohelvolus TaxID=67362 RepID=UPI003796D510